MLEREKLVVERVYVVNQRAFSGEPLVISEITCFQGTTLRHLW
jgi:hypothetical protein